MGITGHALTTLAKKMQQHDVGALPAGENDRLIGMVTDRDIAVRGVANGARGAHELHGSRPRVDATLEDLASDPCPRSCCAALALSTGMRS